MPPLVVKLAQRTHAVSGSAGGVVELKLEVVNIVPHHLIHFVIKLETFREF